MVEWLVLHHQPQGLEPEVELDKQQLGFGRFACVLLASRRYAGHFVMSVALLRSAVPKLFCTKVQSARICGPVVLCHCRRIIIFSK